MMSGWIDIDKQVPMAGERVIVTIDSPGVGKYVTCAPIFSEEIRHYMDTGVFNLIQYQHGTDGEIFWETGRVIAWAPTPEPYDPELRGDVPEITPIKNSERSYFEIVNNI